jgi:predicted lipoprotein with Yx(FWY)xxD motif
MRSRWWAASGAAAAVIVLAACGSSATSGPGSASTPSSGAAAASSPASSAANAATGIKTASTSIGTVLTNAQGFTLYWFAIDTPTKSNCNGSCASYWPPVTGKPAVASGVSLTGAWGTIKRSDGSTQATYDGHPLYTYKGDSSAGQTGGNGLNLSGGLWYAMTPTGAKPSATPSSSPSSGGGGY